MLCENCKLNFPIEDNILLLFTIINGQIAFKAKVVEAGCGTGNLSNFLSSCSREVVGVDMCPNSLKLANNFKVQSKLKNVSFHQMNLFQPTFPESLFDLVISQGVLQPTSDP